jgi:hypothetical protein
MGAFRRRSAMSGDVEGRPHDLPTLLEHAVPIRVPLAADLELRISVLAGEDGKPAVEAGLWRCSPEDRSREYHRTAAAWRVAAHLVPLVVEGLSKAARRAAEAQMWGPPIGPDRGA